MARREAWPRGRRGPWEAWPRGRHAVAVGALLPKTSQRRMGSKVPFLAAVQAHHILTLTAARGDLTQHRRPALPYPQGRALILACAGPRTVTKESRTAGPSIWEALPEWEACSARWENVAPVCPGLYISSSSCFVGS